MAYEKQTWACGDEITVEKLNHMEDGIAEGGDAGYECVEAPTEVFSGTLIASSMGQLYGTEFNPSGDIDGESITVTLDGTEYELPKVTGSFGAIYGEAESGNPVFTNYPCAIGVNNARYYFFTPQQGTYSVKIEAISEQITTTECFRKAVQSAGLKYVKDDISDLGGVVENDVSGNSASGSLAHAEGARTTASNMNSHAEGEETTASGVTSHAEGARTTASNTCAHAEGRETTASGYASHAEGFSTIASGDYGAHAEGNNTTASGYASHTEGSYTIANRRCQHVIGEYNAEETGAADTKGEYVMIIGNGTAANARSNALAIKWDGTFVFANGTEITPAQFASLLALLNN